jgi:hypothetical protein
LSVCSKNVEAGTAVWEERVRCQVWTSPAVTGRTVTHKWIQNCCSKFWREVTTWET